MLTAFPAPSTTWKETVSDPATGEPAHTESANARQMTTAINRPASESQSNRATEQQDPEASTNEQQTTDQQSSGQLLTE